MKKILVLSLLLFAPFISANNVTFSSPTQVTITLKLEDIQSLPETTYSADLPWDKGMAEFTGVKLSTLLTHVYGDVPEQIDISGLNNYHAPVTRQDILRYQPILAYKKDKHYIKIRDKGPYWVIYPLNLYPELNRTQYHAQMVWQVNEFKLVKE
ncbi:oxidoreductase [Vibrio sp. YIC-376]|uniref:oxidoreductase n=1 Tax=Vibrio sp. YIC-376 TaxID=3136162 RepID=UPI00402AAC67